MKTNNCLLITIFILIVFSFFDKIIAQPIQGSLLWPLKPSLNFKGLSSRATIGYFDNDTSSGNKKDYACGSHCYDGHNGSDLGGVWPYTWYHMYYNTVQVVASAPGTIIEKADGFYDKICYSRWNLPVNYVLLKHADGSQTVYFHLKNGTVTTKPIGASVQADELLGYMGSSGSSSNPHCHFGVIDQNGKHVDPFFQGNAPYLANCNSSTNSSWFAPGQQQSYFTTTLSDILTHYDIPSSTTNCINDEHPYIQEIFNPNDKICFGTYFSQIKANTSVIVNVYTPNNVLWNWWSFLSPSTNRENYTNISYKYTLPSNIPGTWKVTANVNGILTSKTFEVKIPSIITNYPVNSLCKGGYVNATFSLTTSHSSTLSTFYLQLSDKYGNFINPVTIATKQFRVLPTGTASISGQIPQSTESGNAFRIRVIAANPNEAVSDNKNDITIGIGENGIYYTDRNTTESCGSYKPDTIQGIVPTSGIDNYIHYYWQSSIDMVNWVDLISNWDIPYYVPDIITQTTYYRRIVTTQSCSDISNIVSCSVWPAISNSITINGLITQSCYDDPPLIIGSIPTGGNGTYTYQWKSALANSPSYSDILGATSKDYDPPAISDVTWYKRIVNGGCASASNILRVNPSIKNNSILGVDKYEFCGPSPEVNLNGSAATAGSQSPSYRWQKSTDNISWYDDYINYNQNYLANTTTLQNSTYYRRKALFAFPPSNCQDYSSPILIQIDPVITGNTLTAPSVNSFCIPSDPDFILGSTQLGGGTGVYNYRWLETTVSNPNTINILGANAVDYDPPLLTETTRFVRSVSSGACVDLSSPVITITIDPSLCLGRIASTTDSAQIVNSTSRRIYLYPNPSSGELYMNSDNHQNLVVEIYNNIGEILSTQNVFNSKSTINITNLSNGMYLLRIKENGVYVYQQNININK